MVAAKLGLQIWLSLRSHQSARLSVYSTRLVSVHQYVHEQCSCHNLIGQLAGN